MAAQIFTLAHELLVARDSLRSKWAGSYGKNEIDRLGRPFTRAVVTSAPEGRTPYRDAHCLLGTAAQSTFEGMAEKDRSGMMLTPPAIHLKKIPSDQAKYQANPQS